LFFLTAKVFIDFLAKVSLLPNTIIMKKKTLLLPFLITVLTAGSVFANIDSTKNDDKDLLKKIAALEKKMAEQQQQIISLQSQTQQLNNKVANALQKNTAKQLTINRVGSKQVQYN